MANRWGTMETVTDFISGGSKITADGDCSHEIKRRLLLGRKVMSNIDSILKSILKNVGILLCQQRSIYIVKAMVFPIVMYGCIHVYMYKESGMPKN